MDGRPGERAPEAPSLDEFEALNSTQARTRCTVRELLRSLPPDTADTLRAALARPSEGTGKIEHAAIARWLRKHDLAVTTAQTIGRHRNGGCGCKGAA